MILKLETIINYLNKAEILVVWITWFNFLTEIVVNASRRCWTLTMCFCTDEYNFLGLGKVFLREKWIWSVLQVKVKVGLVVWASNWRTHFPRCRRDGLRERSYAYGGLHLRTKPNYVPPYGSRFTLSEAAQTFFFICNNNWFLCSTSESDLSLWQTNLSLDLYSFRA